MNARIGALGADLSARIDVLSNRMDTLGSNLSTCIDKVYQLPLTQADLTSAGLAPTPTTPFKPC